MAEWHAACCEAWFILKGLYSALKQTCDAHVGHMGHNRCIFSEGPQVHRSECGTSACVAADRKARACAGCSREAPPSPPLLSYSSTPTNLWALSSACDAPARPHTRRSQTNDQTRVSICTPGHTLAMAAHLAKSDQRAVVGNEWESDQLQSDAAKTMETRHSPINGNQSHKSQARHSQTKDGKRRLEFNRNLGALTQDAQMARRRREPAPRQRRMVARVCVMNDHSGVSACVCTRVCVLFNGLCVCARARACVDVTDVCVWPRLCVSLQSCLLTHAYRRSTGRHAHRRHTGHQAQRRRPWIEGTELRTGRPFESGAWVGGGRVGWERMGQVSDRKAIGCGEYLTGGVGGVPDRKAVGGST